MTFNMLLASDLHFTDSPKDAYRWGLFPWMRKQVRKHDLKLIALLGDLTDAKDRHAESLTNRIADELAALSKRCPVIFNPGNHDGIQEGRPFFRFTNLIPNVTCLTQPEHRELGSATALFLPHTRDYEEAWKGIDFENYDYIFAHQTFEGCITENGTTLAGLPREVFMPTKALVYSGDIHVPQVVSAKRPRIEYVGAPYRIRFGDSFTPRCLMLKIDGPECEQVDLHYPCISKHLIEVMGDDPLRLFKKAMRRQNVQAGDQVKLRVSLFREDYPQWPPMRASLIDAARKAGIELTGPELKAREQGKVSSREGAREAQGEASPEQALAAHAAKASLSGPLLRAGRRYLEAALEASLTR